MQGREVEIRELVCPPEAEAFRVGTLPGAWPCGSEWVRPSDAAWLLGVDPMALLAHVLDDGIPLNFEGWVSLQWVEGIAETRHRAAEEARLN